MKNICFVFCFFTLLSCKAQPTPGLPKNNDENSLLWEISGNGLKKPSYLYGTFHLLCRDAIKFSDNLKTSIKNADEVYFEMDIDDPANTLGAMLFMNMKNGKKLTDLYSAGEYKRLSSFFKDSLKMNLQYFNRMKPMMLEVMLYPRMMPCKTQSGVDMELMSLAKKENKEIKGFEDIQFQASIFDSIPYDEQAKSLLKGVDSLPGNRRMFAEMMQNYLSQNLSALDEALKDTAISKAGVTDALLKNRNIAWVKQLREIFKTKGIFIGVGAGHLPGEFGVIALLRKEGYSVIPIENKAAAN